MASVAVSEASGGWKQTVSSLRSRLSTTVPALALFSAAAPATETEEAEGRMRERVRSFGSDMRRLRSKSCERVFQRCRRGWSAVTLATAATAEREEPSELELSRLARFEPVIESSSEGRRVRLPEMEDIRL